MKQMLRLSGAAAAWLVLALPAAAQVTWNYATSCAITNGPSSSCTVSGETLVTSGFSAPSGSTYVAGTLTNQGTSGIGLLSPGEDPHPPQHGIDNNGNHELVLLNFGNNRVTLNSISTGWSNTDTDISILGWTGGPEGPTMNITNMATTGLVANGWTLVTSADLDLGKTPNKSGDFTGGTLNTGLPVSIPTSSSWWIISSYFGAATGDLDKGNDYFKLLSVTATCASNSTGGPCNTTPGGGTVPEPGSLALAASAVLGLVWTRRRRKA